MIVYQSIEPGMTLKDIEVIVIRYIEKNNLIAAFKNYNGFP
jgi:methionine aminopeptidase